MPLKPSNAARPLSGRCSLAAALERGGVAYGMSRRELWALLRGVADALELFAVNEADLVPRVPLENRLEDAVVRGSVAIFCPSRAIILPGTEPTIRLTYLADPIEAGPDGRGVEALFLILSPSSAVHDALLARLMELLDDASFRDLLAERPLAERLLPAVRRLDPMPVVAAS